MRAENIQLDDIRVMFMRAREDAPAAIQEAWAEFERAVGLKGRKFYGAYYPESREYRICAKVREDDDPQALGFELMTLPRGKYLRTRLQGEPPAVYARIAPTFDEMVKQAKPDDSRPSIEFYRRRDVIDLMLPIT